ncbi:hypothetical protein AB2N04_15510 [Nitratireductor sp. GISD-1A_MAKvit]|uniref:hypothetical protein n=1 Tax=Nitratireductor sp. GISD-1A_MAKvit TaxID=3234198 RepID=UPI003465803D
MKMSLRLTGEGLTRALRRLAHRASETSEAARRTGRAKEQQLAQARERDDVRRRT